MYRLKCKPSAAWPLVTARIDASGRGLDGAQVRAICRALWTQTCPAGIAAGGRPDKVAGLVQIAPFLRNGVSDMMRHVMGIALARPWGPVIWRSYASRLWSGLGSGANDRAAMTASC